MSNEESATVARFWMTRESARRITNGGNTKGTVPVHGKRSATAIVPLYDQAALDAAVAAEREACAKACDERTNPDQLREDGAFSEGEISAIMAANELCADKIRARTK